MSDHSSDQSHEEWHTHSEDEIRKHIRTYLFVFVGLAVLTAVTVGISYLHLPVAMALLVGLCVASLKGSMVASWFMHLIHEKPIVKWALILTVFMFIVLMLLPVLTNSNQRVV